MSENGNNISIGHFWGLTVFQTCVLNTFCWQFFFWFSLHSFLFVLNEAVSIEMLKKNGHIYLHRPEKIGFECEFRCLGIVCSQPSFHTSTNSSGLSIKNHLERCGSRQVINEILEIYRSMWNSRDIVHNSHRSHQ